MRWEDLGISERIADLLRELGLAEPTPIQEKAIPVILRGADTLVIAPTGSGKTEAAVVPVAELMARGAGGLAIYVTPLRALNRDIELRIRRIFEGVGASVALYHGDTPFSRRRSIKESPPRVLVTTPESLTIMLSNRRMREILSRTRWVIIDEFHELVTSKRGSMLAATLERLTALTRRGGITPQRIALSASIGEPDRAAEFLSPRRAGLGPAAEVVEVPGARDADVSVLVSAGRLIMGKYHDWATAVASIIKRYRDKGPVLVFVNTRSMAEHLGALLRSMNVKVLVHHGSLAKKVRLAAEDALRRGDVDAVIATSSLELGIDIGHISVVVQVGSPRQAVKFLQRLGRSRHSLGGKAVGFIVSMPDIHDVLESLVIARRSLAGDLEPLVIHMKPLDVLLHTVVGMAIEEGGVHPRDVERVISRSYPFTDLSEGEVLEVALYASENRLLRLLSNIFVPTKKGEIYYKTTTTIVDAPKYDVIDALSDRKIGELDEDFVAAYLSRKAGDMDEFPAIVLAGRAWGVISVEHDSRRIYVEELRGAEADIPRWSGETIPVERGVAREVCALRRFLLKNGKLPSHYSRISVGTSQQGYDPLKSVIQVLSEQVRRGYPLPGPDELVIEISEKEGRFDAFIHSCLGHRGNRALAHLIEGLLRESGARPRGHAVTPYGVFVSWVREVPRGVRESLAEMLGSVTASDVEDIVRQEVCRSDMYRIVLYRVLTRMGTLIRVSPKNAAAVLRQFMRKACDGSVVDREVINEVFTRYADVSLLKRFLGKVLSKGRVRELTVSEFSPIARSLLRNVMWVERVDTVAPMIPKELVVRAVKERVRRKDVTLVCLLCGFSWNTRVAFLPDVIRCEKCGKMFVGLLPRYDDRELLKKVRAFIRQGRRARVKADEDIKYVFRSAELISYFGRRAVEALAGRGVGPETAKRILGYSGDDFYYMIYLAERRYLATRRFWARKGAVVSKDK